MNDEYRRVLDEAHSLALGYLDSLPVRPVAREVDHSELVGALATELGDEPVDPEVVVRELATAVEPGLVASNGGRYFGFVTGATLPGALGADWLASAWDQNTALWVMSPAAIAAQGVASAWLLDLLDLPDHAQVGFVTGAQMANWTCLAAARHKVLADVGWDVETRGLRDAPLVRMVVGEHRHSTIDRALRFLGFGTESMSIVPSDDQGRMRVDRLADTLASLDGPLIVCAQAGEVNTGAFDSFGPIIDLAHRRGGWVHVDGAFGLWARACADRRPLAHGVEAADSWSVDGHKWLNVPYDTGFAITVHPEAHAASMTQLAPYLVAGDDARLDPMNWSPDASRRARGFATYAAIRSLGRSGIDDLVGRSCRLARRLADGLGMLDGVAILNEVVLNQVLVHFGADGDGDARTRAVIERVQRDGTCWAGGTSFKGKVAMRISVSSWVTTEDDVDRAVEAIARCANAC